MDIDGAVPTKKVANRALKGAKNSFAVAGAGAGVVSSKKEVYYASEGGNNSVAGVTGAVGVTDARSDAGVEDSDGVIDALSSDLKCSETPCSDLVRSEMGVLDVGSFVWSGHNEGASSGARIPKVVNSDDDVHAVSGFEVTNVEVCRASMVVPPSPDGAKVVDSVPADVTADGDVFSDAAAVCFTCALASDPQGCVSYFALVRSDFGDRNNYSYLGHVGLRRKFSLIPSGSGLGYVKDCLNTNWILPKLPE